MPFHGTRKYHHSSTHPTWVKPCAICGQPFLMYWKDKEELNGFSDTVTERKGGNVHYFCIPGAKSLQQLNEERKLKANNQ